MALLALCAFVVALLLARYGTPTVSILSLLAGILALVLSQMALDNAVEGHPWVRQDVLDPNAVWWVALAFVVGSLLGLGVKVRRDFFNR